AHQHAAGDAAFAVGAGQLCHAAGKLDTARQGRGIKAQLLRLCQQPSDKLEALLGGDRSALEGWLFVVARNLAIDVARKSGRVLPAGHRLPQRPAAGPTPAAAAEKAELADRIIALIDDLPPKQAQVIHLRFEQGLSYKAIADLTGLTVSYVGYLLHEGLKTLRQRATAQSHQTRASA
ncbi:MAG: sigma-70 family RNA polymerase sigma factor, partial [Planctomycetes bacterium]|nr:sigma-70 family RNA polymerase sigma factor [Planctomycetota bacterium]